MCVTSRRFCGGSTCRPGWASGRTTARIARSGPWRSAVRLHVQRCRLDAQPGGQSRGPLGHCARTSTPRLVAREQFGIGADIIHGQWSSLALGTVDSRTLLFYGAGNGHLYGFEALDSNISLVGDGLKLLKPVWQINGHPLRADAGPDSNRTLPRHAFVRSNRFARVLSRTGSTRPSRRSPTTA